MGRRVSFLFCLDVPARGTLSFPGRRANGEPHDPGHPPGAACLDAPLVCRLSTDCGPSPYQVP